MAPNRCFDDYRGYVTEMTYDAELEKFVPVPVDRSGDALQSVQEATPIPA